MMSKLQTLVQSGYATLANYLGLCKIILLHPDSRYRSLVIAELLSRPPLPTFYYCMSTSDVNLESFLAGFSHDLAEQAPSFGRHLNQAMRRNGSTYPSDEVLEDSFLNDLAALHEDDFLLVIDEYDASEHAHDVQKFLESILRNIPDNCQLIINSRTLPRLPWTAMIARGEAIILRDAEPLDSDIYGLQQADAVADIDVRSLGVGTIAKNNTLIEQWEGHLPRLLYIFTLERPVVTRAEICRAFWPDLDNDQAVNVFHVTKRRLHKALGFDALVHENGYYRANPDVNIRYDVSDFVNALMRGRAKPDNADLWQAAITLYAGPFLQGQMEDWIVQQRVAYHQGYIEATLALANLRVEEGRSEQALRLLTQASAEDQHFELLDHGIMRLYAQMGRRSEVASHYQNLVQMLQMQGLTPSSETQKLYQELMA